MACRSLRSSFSIFIVIIFAFIFLGGVFRGDFVGSAFAQESDRKTSSSSQSRGGDRPYLQKMAMRARRATYPPKQSLGGAPATPPPASSSNAGSTVWAPLGPAPLASDATGDGAQDYNWVSGRATSVLIDPADSTGNTV